MGSAHLMLGSSTRCPTSQQCSVAMHQHTSAQHLAYGSTGLPTGQYLPEQPLCTACLAMHTAGACTTMEAQVSRPLTPAGTKSMFVPDSRRGASGSSPSASKQALAGGKPHKAMGIASLSPQPSAKAAGSALTSHASSPLWCHLTTRCLCIADMSKRVAEIGRRQGFAVCDAPS